MSRNLSSRVDTLDATKGALVVFMVIYHSLNYSTQYYLAFKYVSFLPPSFILITGFLLTTIYVTRHEAGETGMYTRLLTRGAKLIVLFTLLNLTAQFVHSKNYHHPIGGVAYFFDHWPDIYLLGHTRAAAFEILVPIGYLLLAAPALILAATAHRAVLPVLGLTLLAASVALEWNGVGSSHLNLISAGVLGMWMGRISFQGLDRLRRYFAGALAGYGAYVAAGLAWGQPFLLQLAGAVLGLAAIYGAVLRWHRPLQLRRWLIFLGKYSLISYIVQIGLLQAFSHFAGRPEPVSLELAGFILGTLLVTTLVLQAIEWSRTRLPVVNGAYRAVFA